VLTHLFDPFFTTKPEGVGTGLGLSTVYGIVRQAGGAIDVTSAPGRGARFDIYFPKVDAPAPAPTRDAEPRSVRGSETVLIAEDEAPLRAVVGAALRELGYEVIECEESPDAVRIASEHVGRIDLLVADVIMPKLRGPELAARVRELRPDIKVLFMSGYADDAELAGPDGRRAALLAKPFTPEALARKVREVLDGEGAPSTSRPRL
jgi:two-component system cell cycle sensor histidine kinase/response regulator CckA